MIPLFDDNGNLPAGIHDATIEEVGDRFAINSTRTKLFEASLEVLTLLRNSNCPEVYPNGSFSTTKENPGDYDLCYEPTGLTPTQELLEFFLGSDARKARFLGDIFPRMPHPPYHYDYVQDWQTDTRQDDVVKGIIRINLRPEADD
ncbi:MAG: hypothetical protein K8F91_07670 [Candidatus Obscuribacterales bacterium]|nr:hypothetical protein [Candidatus Obscuribacterales bacterium]